MSIPRLALASSILGAVIGGGWLVRQYLQLRRRISKRALTQRGPRASLRKTAQKLSVPRVSLGKIQLCRRNAPAVVDLRKIAQVYGRFFAVRLAREILRQLSDIAGAMADKMVICVCSSRDRHATNETPYRLILRATGDDSPVCAFEDGHIDGHLQDLRRVTLLCEIGPSERQNIASDDKVLRDVVVARVLPLIIRLLPCYNEVMARCVVRVVKNFIRPTETDPAPLFIDVLPLLSNPRASEWLVEKATTFVSALQRERRARGLAPITSIVALETRGFLFGVKLATRLNMAFVPMRRPGRYPGRVVIRQDFTKATGRDSLELDAAVLGIHEAVLLVDDLLVSGASLVAATNALNAARAEVAGSFVPLEVQRASGRTELKQHRVQWPLRAPIVLEDMALAPNVEDIMDPASFGKSSEWQPAHPATPREKQMRMDA